MYHDAVDLGIAVIGFSPKVFNLMVFRPDCPHGMALA